MKIYIDQSGKVEYTSHDTVVAFSNGIRKAILLKASDKRLLQKRFREAGKGQIFTYRIFSLLIFLLLKKVRFEELVIDIEYPGRSDLIKNYLLTDLKKTGVVLDRDKISFRLIGKKCEAHWHAYHVFKGMRKAEKVTNMKEILNEIFQ